MSAPIPVPTANAGGYEPSMEEILASIRRIIADDQSIPKAVAAEALPQREPEAVPAPVHRLHEPPSPAVAEPTAPEPSDASDAMAEAMVAQGTIAAPQYPMPDAPPAATIQAHGPPAEADVATRHAVPGPRETPSHPAETTSRRFPSEANPLFSADTNKSVSSAFNALAVSRLADNSDELMAIARDMIRPLLRSWIDDNLPTMVERMVRDEIERVARGGP